jgi:hypothetical protein
MRTNWPTCCSLKADAQDQPALLLALGAAGALICSASPLGMAPGARVGQDSTTKWPEQHSETTDRE